MNDLLKNDFGKRVLSLITKQQAVVALIIIFVGMAFSGTNFYSTYNLFEMVNANSVYMIMAFGITLTLIAGGVDLSIGGVLVLSGIIVIKLMDVMPIWMTVLVALCMGAVVGVINGYLTVYQKTEPVIITLGIGMVLKGFAQQLTDAHPIAAKNPDFMVLGNTQVFGTIPSLVIIMLVMLALSHYILRYTEFGRNLYAIGGDYEVAKYSGIDVLKTKAMTYVLSGIIAALAGVLLSSKLNSGSSIYGDAATLLVPCGVVIGGTSFAGGIGSMPQSAIGFLVFAVLDNSMMMLGIDSYVQMLFRGVVIVSIICLDCYKRKRIREAV